jgi:cytochrome b involved in lipid metabolism
MMRTLFIASTIAFWFAVAGLWAADRPAVEAARPATPAAERRYTAAEVGQHRTQKDCWMVIDGQVYDISSYFEVHPAEPAILLPWCGKEATQAYRTKTLGRPHSARADAMLPKYRIGVFAGPK